MGRAYRNSGSWRDCPEGGRTKPTGKEKQTPPGREDDSLIIEDNTVYEVDLECIECMRRYGKPCR